MDDCKNKEILICSNLKKARVLFFSYFDENEAGMIYSAKDLKGCDEILESEKIDSIVIDYDDKLIGNPEQIKELKQKYQHLKVLLLVSKNKNLSQHEIIQLNEQADAVFIEPISKQVLSKSYAGVFSENQDFEIKAGTPPVEPNKQEKKQTQTVQVARIENSEELWRTLFEDSNKAKLIVNAKNQKIIHVNDALLKIFKTDAESLKGQAWEMLDSEDNQHKYPGYIKEINANEKLSFTLSHLSNNKKVSYQATYQLGVLGGDFVFIGDIEVEKAQGVSSEIYDNFLNATTLDTFSSTFVESLNQLKTAMSLDFIIFAEYLGLELSKPVTTADNDCANDIIDNYLNFLVDKAKEDGKIELNESSSKINEISTIFNTHGLHELYVYIICHKNNLYGILIAGTKDKKSDAKANSLILQTLVLQSKFNLFQKKIMHQRAKEGQIDQLTKLPNRSSMTTKFAEILEKGVSSDKYLSLMIIDIEKLNYLNQDIGLELTDEIIVSVSQIIVQVIGSKGQVYRLSGNEFVVLLHPHQDKKLVENEVKTIIKRLNHPILISNGDEKTINFNIGISIFPDDGQTVSSMMKNADLAMYDAKLAGKNNYIIFKYSETGQALKQRTQMEENLKKAIDNNHIKVFFQPKIDAVTEDIVGFEALVRWLDPELGLINPGHFIPLAEETKLINPIGEFVAKQACKKIIEWQRKFGLSLSCSINLSVVQLMDEKLPKKLEKIVNDSGAHPHFIDFEITETINLDVVPNLVELLNEIVDIGCTLSIDDFGTGHSSLDYVKKIPANFIKIDQSFVKNIGLNPEDEAILDATIDIAKRLNRKIIAEGVETEEQREYLIDREVEFFQGFLFATPMSEEKVEELLEQRVQLMGSE